MVNGAEVCLVRSYSLTSSPPPPNPNNNNNNNNNNNFLSTLLAGLALAPPIGMNISDDQHEATSAPPRIRMLGVHRAILFAAANEHSGDKLWIHRCRTLDGGVEQFKEIQACQPTEITNLYSVAGAETHFPDLQLVFAISVELKPWPVHISKKVLVQLTISIQL
ncbi:hypothetical protein HCDG_04498 [Histoplasma capsulatum H143]|uniref:Uncharacterized protein n=1 Tax=Ajellomyces capsulatus (strain H143) TaxID=544712 RepID=C6HE67_AJECH|nr:hypothetical protein HCDG_04498 [Histoplasma capsulatum H143]